MSRSSRSLRSRFVFVTTSVGALALGLLAPPGGVSVAEGCSGSSQCGGPQGWKTVALVTKTAPVALEGVLLAATSSPSPCSSTPSPSSLVVAAKKADGTTVPGVVSQLTMQAPSVFVDASYVLLWKPATPLEPSTEYTLEVSGPVGTGGASGAGGGTGALPALTFSTAAATGTIVQPSSITATLTPKDVEIETTCCHTVDGKSCSPKNDCVAVVGATYRQLDASFVPATPPPLGAYLRYSLIDTSTGASAAQLDAWSIGATASWSGVLKDTATHCVIVQSENVLSGEKVMSQTVCPTPITVDSTPVTHCAELASLIASCDVKPQAPPYQQLDPNAKPLQTTYCSGAAGAGAGGAGTAAGGGAGTAAGDAGAPGKGGGGGATSSSGAAGMTIGAAGSLPGGGAAAGAGPTTAGSNAEPAAVSGNGGCAVSGASSGSPLALCGVAAALALLVSRRRRAV